MTIAQQQFNPGAYKETIRQQWDSAAGAWDACGPALEEWLGPATEAMLDLAHVAEGSRVLDVAAGAGGQSVSAARRAGPRGRVLATDISAGILGYADRRFAAAGLGNAETRVMDGEEIAVAAGALASELAGAGFSDIEVREVDAPLRLPSAADCLRFERESFGALQQMLSGLSGPERESAWSEVGEALRQFEHPGGFTGPCRLLVGAGTR